MWAMLKDDKVCAVAPPSPPPKKNPKVFQMLFPFKKFTHQDLIISPINMMIFKLLTQKETK